MKNDNSSSRTMYEILQAPDKLKNEVKGVGGILAHVWRSILDNCHIGLSQFDGATVNWIRNARKAQRSSKITNILNRSNIYREMARPNMTFKVFLKALQIIGVKRVRFSVEFEYGGRVTQHSTVVTLNSDDAVLSLSERDNENDKTAADPPGI